MLIDCDTCAVRGLHCDDCVVGVFLTLPPVDGPPATQPTPPTGATELDDTEADALRSLVSAGLVPPLRLVALAAPPDPERGIA